MNHLSISVIYNTFKRHTHTHTHTHRERENFNPGAFLQISRTLSRACAIFCS